MADPSCLYTILHAPRERHESLLRGVVAPLARRFAGAAPLDSLFFARYNKPDWQLRFRILGEPGWIADTVRPAVDRALAGAEVDGTEFASYERECDRYGGETGMRLAERLFTVDTLACLDLLELEAGDGLERSRREWSLVYVERLFDLFGFDAARRAELYRFSYSWTLDQDFWDEDDLALLAERYAALKDDLHDLLRGESSRDAAGQCGGEEAARIVERAMASTAPVAAEIAAGVAAGRVTQELSHLAWSYSHMHCNRLGIEAHPEAILRYFMHRFYEDHPDSPS